jgi:hypothetical protein
MLDFSNFAAVGTFLTLFAGTSWVVASLLALRRERCGSPEERRRARRPVIREAAFGSGAVEDRSCPWQSRCGGDCQLDGRGNLV